MDAHRFLGEHRVMLAPMAGVSDAAMRRLCREQGAQLAFTEMVSSKGLSYANEKTAHLIDTYEGEDAIGVQLFGHEPDTMAAQARFVAETLGERLAVIDINMGCPVRKIVSKGDGAALMKEPDVARSIIEQTSAAVGVPVSVKFRRGFEEGEETAVAFAQMAQEAGAAWVCVHGRYARQMYRGSSDASVIARVVEAIDIPVVGNGDVRSGADALALVETTGCSAVMVARAAEGNPWVFADIRAAFDEVPQPDPPSAGERIEMARRHARLLDEGDRRQLVRMRKQAAWYCKGLPGASAAREQLTSCTTLADFEAVFDEMSARVAKE